MAAGILNHVLGTGQAMAGKVAVPMAGPTNGANGANGSTGTNGTNGSENGSSSTATISANDFLTLLVTEMQNQDPTSTMDPNAYIDQLVQVNSLEQLININQTLSTALGGTATPGNGSTKQAAGADAGMTGASPASASGEAGAAHRVGALPANPPGIAATQNAAGDSTRGNLSAPRAKAAAERVAHALDGRTHALPARGGAKALQ
jgi:flagellar basal-body rod modification protein FlgD